MAQRNEKVFERVRDELTKNPKLGSRELYELGQEVDKGVANDSLQQFHARYVLPVKREQSAARGGGRRRGGRKGSRKASARAEAATKGASGKRAAKGGAERDRVRSVLLDFARDFADAESRAEIVQVLSRIDDYVERIAPAGG
ncbi:MAG: hypothetical protein WD766_04035 [Gemmatimonadota bacterium]